MAVDRTVCDRAVAARLSDQGLQNLALDPEGRPGELVPRDGELHASLLPGEAQGQPLVFEDAVYRFGCEVFGVVPDGTLRRFVEAHSVPLNYGKR